MSRRASQILAPKMSGHMCEILDNALIFAEDILICRQNYKHEFLLAAYVLDDSSKELSICEERDQAKKYLCNMMMDDTSTEFQKESANIIVSMMTREEYHKNNIIWDHGVNGTSLTVVVSGELISLVDETGASEIVKIRSIVGELGLVHNIPRLTILACSSPTAVLYSLDIESWKELKDNHPKVSALINRIAIHYLDYCVQHVSNRYFHTTLPV